MEQLNIIKIGGNIIDDEQRLHSFLESFAQLKGYKILVHGGGKIATQIGHRLGIEPNYSDGRRITDAATLELVTMVYGGLINKKIVAGLQHFQCNAIGLTGADGGILKAAKRPVKDLDYGFVGDILPDGVNTATLVDLLRSGLNPVIAPLSFSIEGTLLNTNADTIANAIAKAMSAIVPVNLIYCFEQRGVLKDATDPLSVLPVITLQDFEQYKSNAVISGGMIPKLENAFEAIEHGVKKVVIGQAEELQQLIDGIGGTTIL